MIRNVQDGDIRTSGRQFAERRDEVAQSIRARLRMFLGESFVDITQGTPWFQSILGKSAQDVAEISIKQRMLTAPGVLQIRKFNFEPDLGRRTLRIDATVIGAQGEDVPFTLSEVII